MSYNLLEATKANTSAIRKLLRVMHSIKSQLPGLPVHEFATRVDEVRGECTKAEEAAKREFRSQVNQ